MTTTNQLNKLVNSFEKAAESYFKDSVFSGQELEELLRDLYKS